MESNLGSGVTILHHLSDGEIDATQNRHNFGRLQRHLKSSYEEKLIGCSQNDRCMGDHVFQFEIPKIQCEDATMD